MAFMEKMKDVFDKGVKVSKEALSKAGDAVQDFGDKSVIRIEIKQLESKLDKEYESLGTQVHSFFQNNKEDTLSYNNAQISGVINEIDRLLAQIADRKEALRQLDDDSQDSSTDSKTEE